MPTFASTHTAQTPIHSGFGPTTTAQEVVAECNLKGKVAIVTGGYSGIGLETTRALTSAGAKVIVPARNSQKARDALRSMAETVMEILDLMNPASIDEFAKRFLETGQALHILINNAGIMAPPLVRDSRGYESQFSTNHLGHFHLTCRLWSALRQANGARVVSLSSYAHRRSGVDFDDWNFQRRPYDRWQAYGQSKTANALFALALDGIGRQYGVRAFSVHPGGVVTDLIRNMTAEEIASYRILDAAGKPIIDPERNLKTPEQGAATSVWCATSTQLNGLGGVYCADCDIAPALPSDDSTELHGVRPRATNPEFAARLWSLSEQLTGVTAS